MGIVITGGTVTRARNATHISSSGVVTKYDSKGKKSSSSKSSGSSSKSIYVYDKEAQQTRKLSPFEASGISYQAEKSAVSTEPSSQTFTEQRTTLLNDPTVKKVYVAPSSSGSPKIIGVERTATPKATETIKAETATKTPSLYTGGTGVYAPAKKTTKVGSFLSSVKGSFVRGFTFKADPLGRDIRTYGTSESIGYVGGLVGGIATLGAGTWERVGAKTSTILYTNPKVWSATTKATSFLSKKPARIVGTGLFATYLGTSGYSIAKSETREEAISKSFGVTRTVVGFTGFGRGFNEQTALNIKKTSYLLKGESRAFTSTLENRFGSSTRSSGTVYRVFNNRIDNVGTFKEMATIKGSSIPISTTKETSVSLPTKTSKVLANIKSSTEIYGTKGKFKTQISSDTNLKAFRATKQEFLEVSVGGKTITSGAGKSKFTFLKDTIGFERGQKFYLIEQGAGVSNFQFRKIGKVSFYRGQTSSATPKVASNIKFKEIVFDMSGYSGSVSSGGLQSRLVQKSVSSNILKVFGTTKTASVKPLGVVIPKTEKITKPQSSIVKTVSPSKGVVNSRATMSAFSSIAMPKQQRFDIGMASAQAFGSIEQASLNTTIDGRFGSRSSYRSRTNFASDLALKQELGLSQGNDISQIVGARTGVKTRQSTIPRSDLRQRDIMRTFTNQLPANIVGGRIGGFRAEIPKPPAGFGFAIKDKDFGLSRSSFKNTRFKEKYTPSIEAGLFGIKASKADERLLRSGLVVRPIIR